MYAKLAIVAKQALHVVAQEALHQRDMSRDELQVKVDDGSSLTQTIAQLRQDLEQRQFDCDQLEQQVL